MGFAEKESGGEGFRGERECVKERGSEKKSGGHKLVCCLEL